MLQEDKKINKKINPNFPNELAKDSIRDLLLYIFAAISGAVTFLMALSMWSLWPFVGWPVAVIAFALLLDRFDR